MSVYLLQTREFINSGENVYKIGKTKQNIRKRLCGYPKGTILFFETSCSDCDSCEKDLINFFKNKYKLRSDYGREYFQGDHSLMIRDMIRLVDERYPKGDQSDSVPEDVTEDISGQMTEIKIVEEVKPFTKFKIGRNNKDTYPYRLENGDIIFDTLSYYTTTAIKKLVNSGKIIVGDEYDITDKHFIKMFRPFRNKIDDDKFDLVLYGGVKDDEEKTNRWRDIRNFFSLWKVNSLPLDDFGSKDLSVSKKDEGRIIGTIRVNGMKVALAYYKRYKFYYERSRADIFIPYYIKRGSNLGEYFYLNKNGSELGWRGESNVIDDTVWPIVIGSIKDHWIVDIKMYKDKVDLMLQALNLTDYIGEFKYPFLLSIF